MWKQMLGGMLPKISLFLLAITLAAPGLGVAQNVTIYSDGLANGWQDYGYATENYTNTSPVHSGSNSISVSLTAGFLGIQIHHPVFTNTAYSSISFWLHGGPTGGQHLRVYGVLGGVNQTTNYLLSPPMANTWQHYTVPLAGFGVARATNFEAFVIQDSAGTAEPFFYLDDIQLNSTSPPAIFNVLHTFANLPEQGTPVGGLVLAGNSLYGTTYYGGTNASGMVYKINMDGTGFTDLYSCPANFAGGSEPAGTLALSGSWLYGTTEYGGLGPNGGGTLFVINTNGGFTNLYSFTDDNNSYFTNSDGAQPYAGLVLANNTLYGTTINGGTNSTGTIFAFNTASLAITNLHNFAGNLPGTNNDGSNPMGRLLLAGNTLYGTTVIAGTNGSGTLFKINTDGTGFTVLHHFFYLTDGSAPESGLVLSSSNILYGTTYSGGTNGSGAVFAISTNGTGFKVLYFFSAQSGTTNDDGAHPRGGLLLAGNTLYGTASFGGNFNRGTVFDLNTDGTGFTVLHQFSSPNINYLSNATNSDGYSPEAELILSNNTLYGTAAFGGTNAYGTVFSIALPGPPPLNLSRTGTNVFLTWSTNDARFILQSVTNLAPTAVWATVAPAPVAINGRYVVTNGISGTRRFYRLSQ